jgi:hypothetical protein
VSLKLDIDQFVKVDPPVISASQQTLHATKRAKPTLVIIGERFKRLARARRLPCDRLNHREQIACPMLKLGKQHLLAILQCAQVVDVG